ncbi:MAG: tetratricopeptide repeat protein [Salinivirgaceae bacterium]|nr:tetratricopeptide repeat protein [Salinivirgaceae bacterium]
MKKLILLAILIGSIGFTQAQNKKVVSAYNYAKPKYNQLDKAIVAIDEAKDHPKTMEDPKTWYYRGMIYQNIYQDSSWNHLHDQPILVAMESFTKSLELDEKGRYEKDVISRFNVALQQARNEAIEALKAKDYETAYKIFVVLIDGAAHEKTMDLAEIYKPTYFYAGYSAEESGKMDEAKQLYKKSIEQGVETARSYIRIALILQKEEDAAGYLATIKEGVEKAEDNKDLLLLLIDYYNKNDKMEDALVYINKAIEKDPENVKLYQAQGDIYNALGNAEKAQEAYDAAMKIDPDNVDVMFNTGTLFFNRAVEYRVEAGKLDLDQEEEYNALLEKMVAEFEQAAKYFERAHELAPKDEQILKTLKKIFMQLRNQEGISEKIEEVNKKLENL